MCRLYYDSKMQTWTNKIGNEHYTAAASGTGNPKYDHGWAMAGEERRTLSFDVWYRHRVMISLYPYSSMCMKIETRLVYADYSGIRLLCCVYISLGIKNTVCACSPRWLNEDLVLKQRVLNLEHDLSNGYLLGEILHVHNHQRNFHLFQVRAPYSGLH